MRALDWLMMMAWQENNVKSNSKRFDFIYDKEIPLVVDWTKRWFDKFKIAIFLIRFSPRKDTLENIKPRAYFWDFTVYQFIQWQLVVGKLVFFRKSMRVLNFWEQSGVTEKLSNMGRNIFLIWEWRGGEYWIIKSLQWSLYTKEVFKCLSCSI